MSNVQLEFTTEEILATDRVDEPMVLEGVRCHGGFLSDGSYVTPRTRFRKPAIAAWREHHAETIGTPILHAPLETWPENFPNVAQSKLLLAHGVREPIVANLTRIGTVEGFGAMLGMLAIADMQRFFVEDVRETAIGHLEKGLLEAHGRDEGGWAEEAGHRHMWFVARDIAFEHPLTEDQSALMMERLGFPSSGGSYGGGTDDRRARFLAQRMFEDLDIGLEMLLSMLVRVLFVECKAFHVFQWAQELLVDSDLVAGDGAAADLVGRILADEIPHVGYAEIALTEMRDRTFVGLSGRRYAGVDIIGPLWDRSLEDSLGLLEEQNRAFVRSEVENALAARRDGADLLAEFNALATS